MRIDPGTKVLITGAASGIGKCIAKRFAAAGCALYLIDCQSDSLASFVAELREQGHQVACGVFDLSSPQQVATLVEQVTAEWGTPQILINNAGVAWYGPLNKMPIEQWDRVLGINLHAPINLTCRLLERMLQYPEAHVVNMASICGLVAANRLTAYSTSKFGLVGFTEALRGEYGRRGLGVTAVCPGPVRTNIYGNPGHGKPDGKIPTPPWWTSTTPEHVAELTFRAVVKDRRLVVITWLARLVYACRCLCPWLLDGLQRIGRQRKIRAKYAAFQQAEPQVSAYAPAKESRQPSLSADRKAA